MVLSKGILLKGLLGLGTLAGATTLGVVYREEIASLFAGNGGDIDVGGKVGEGNQNAQGGAGSQGAAGEVTVDSFKAEIKKMGIKVDCQINDLEGEKTCSSFNKDNLKNLMFPFKEEGEDLVIEGMGDDFTITLKIKKASDLDIFTSGTKYTIETNESITIKKSGDNSDTNKILLMAGTNPEFTVKDEKLVMAWDAEKLGKKVGLKCGKDKCTFKDSIKVLKEGEVQTLNISDASGKEISFSEETANYNQGFKFTVPEGGIKGENDTVILEAGKYEIKCQEGGGWGLSPSNN